MAFQNSQIDAVLTEKIVDAQARPIPPMPQRDVWLPQVKLNTALGINFIIK
jgi:hypothetical protein